MQVGLTALDEMDESLLDKIIKTEPLDIQPKIVPNDYPSNEVEREMIKNSNFFPEKQMVSPEPSEKNSQISSFIGSISIFDIDASFDEKMIQLERQIRTQFQEDDENDTITNSGDEQLQVLNPGNKTGLETNENIQQGKKRRYTLDKSSDYAGKNKEKKSCDIQKSAPKTHGTKERSSFKYCNDCRALFCTSQGLENHMNEVHLNIKSHHCEQCDKYFSHKVTLKIHIEIVHQKLKSFNCNYYYCESFFYRYRDLKRHVGTVHLKIKPMKKKPLL